MSRDRYSRKPINVDNVLALAIVAELLIGLAYFLL